jgi:hypothetical protein
MPGGVLPMTDAMGTHDIRTRLPARAVVLPTTLIVAVLLGATGVVASVLASLAVDVPVAYLFTDTSDAVVRFGCEGRSCMLAGGLSNVGVLLWAVAAITAVFAACLRPDSSSRKPLLAGGALSALLLADELFRLHDTKLGGSSLLETVIMVGYAGLAVMLVRTAGAWLRGTDVALLVAAFGLLATSVAIDRVASWMGLYAEGGVGILIEDGVKFIGIVCWAFYWTGAAAAARRA